jgi:hypothetical protein
LYDMDRLLLSGKEVFIEELVAIHIGGKTG